GDAFGLVQPRKVWIDHATIKWTSDGFSDIGEGSEDITLSYVNYDGRTEYSCDGHHAVTSFITNSEVTIHHSRFDHVRSNAPRASGSGSRVHLFNNVFSNVLSWAIGSACQAVILVE